jgi:hypothetical protein
LWLPFLLLVFRLLGDSGPFILIGSGGGGGGGISELQRICDSGIRSGMWPPPPPLALLGVKPVAKLPSQLTVLCRCNRFICGRDKT